MIPFLHSFIPQSILFSWGVITIHWYGLTMATAITAALMIILSLSKLAKINQNKIWDLVFWLVIFGLIGARIYEIFLNFPFYWSNPGQTIKVWEGGLAIHGAIIAGLITAFIYCRHHQLNFWKISAILSVGAVLGQAIGRWGNWFNQELFGLPTNLPWGIPISLTNRPTVWINYQYFQPTFLYESLGCLLIFLIFYWLLRKKIKANQLTVSSAKKFVGSYLIFYSLLRFSLEFIKIDETPIFLGWRWPQIISLIIIFLSLFLIIDKKHVKTV